MEPANINGAREHKWKGGMIEENGQDLKEGLEERRGRRWKLRRGLCDRFASSGPSDKDDDAPNSLETMCTRFWREKTATHANVFPPKRPPHYLINSRNN
jgi:hypothetical protein